MKKIIMTLIMVMSVSLMNAITLFPHFVDVAGDFEDGTTDKFVELSIPTIHWRVSPSFYNNIKEADDFLMDTLPTSSYVIEKETKTLDDGTEIIIYISSLEADGLYKDKWSRLYLIQSTGEPLYVGLYEDQLN